ncbi:hypothetical protein BMS_2907 [Halobacteriovorax marinus SJ]|uniref:Lipoprotein n=2 Tax=Halobacteriovorax marinus TaxID=97084 RepID=E1WYN8_HALMS|nr:hypothetical protein BMS_2907 [Halobacteriovorax marinus SJ]
MLYIDQIKKSIQIDFSNLSGGKMKKILMTILMSLTFVSCSTSSLKVSQDDQKVYKLFNGVILDQNELIAMIEEYSKGAENVVNKEAAEVAESFIRESNYSELLFDKAQSSKSYSEFEENSFKFIDKPIVRKLNLLRLKKIDGPEFTKYIENFNRIEDAAKRLDLVEKIVEVDFPNFYQGDFSAKLLLMISKLDSTKKQLSFYRRLISNLKLITLQLNLYLFQAVPTKTLSEIVKIQEDEEYKKSRAFIEEFQLKTNEEYLEMLSKRLEENGIEKVEFVSLLGKPNS